MRIHAQAELALAACCSVGHLVLPSPTDFRQWNGAALLSCLLWTMPDPWCLPAWAAATHKAACELPQPRISHPRECVLPLLAATLPICAESACVQQSCKAAHSSALHGCMPPSLQCTLPCIHAHGQCITSSSMHAAFFLACMCASCMFICFIARVVGPTLGWPTCPSILKACPCLESKAKY